MTGTPPALAASDRSLKAIGGVVAFFVFGFLLLFVGLAADRQAPRRRAQRGRAGAQSSAARSRWCRAWVCCWRSGSPPGSIGVKAAAPRCRGAPVADRRAGKARGFGMGLAAGRTARGARDAARRPRSAARRGSGTAAAPPTTPAAWSRRSALLAPAALAEEIMFRGVPLVLLARVLGRPARRSCSCRCSSAWPTSSIPTSARSAIGNIALAGIFLGSAFYAPGGIWTAWGAHLGWNATLAALGAPVSGLPFDIPFIDYARAARRGSPAGPSGPRAGCSAPSRIAAAIVVAARWTRKERRHEPAPRSSARARWATASPTSSRSTGGRWR